jgi:hypothetical protein
MDTDLGSPALQTPFVLSLRASAAHSLPSLSRGQQPETLDRRPRNGGDAGAKGAPPTLGAKGKEQRELVVDNRGAKADPVII